MSQARRRRGVTLFEMDEPEDAPERAVILSPIAVEGRPETFAVDAADGEPLGMICYSRRSGIWESYDQQAGGSVIGYFRTRDAAANHCRRVHDARRFLQESDLAVRRGVIL